MNSTHTKMHHVQSLVEKVLLFSFKCLGEVKKYKQHKSSDYLTHRETFILILRKMVMWNILIFLPNYTLPKSANTSIGMVVCKNDLLACICCIYSFIRASKFAMPLYIFDDGSLSRSDINVLRILFHNVWIITNDVANQKVRSKYINIAPSSLLAREKIVYLRKKIDIPLLVPSDKILQFDSDILHFSYPKELIDWASNNSDHRTLFMNDCVDSHIMSNIEFESIFHTKLIKNLNSGIIAIEKKRMIITITEKFCRFILSEPSIIGRPWLIQTIYSAFLAYVHKALIYRLPSKYYIGLEDDVIKKLVCRHYASTTRKYFYRDAIPLLFSYLAK